jgi:hypothetical protein
LHIHAKPPILGARRGKLLGQVPGSRRRLVLPYNHFFTTQTRRPAALKTEGQKLLGVFLLVFCKNGGYIEPIAKLKFCNRLYYFIKL